MKNWILHKLWFAVNVIKIYDTWVKGFLDYFGILGKRKILHRLRDGSRFEIRTKTNDFGIINEVYIVKEYHKLLNFIKKDSVVIDIGGQIGVFSIFASRIAKEGKILSFEPFVENYEMLQKNIKLNGLTNVKLFKLGVAGKSGRRELVISKENTGGHSFYETNGKKVEVETITLEDVFKKNKISKCDFLKMDCEGAEFEILLNTPKNILKKINSIAMEYHEEAGSVLELKKFLEKSGFSVELKKDVGTGMIYAWR